MLIAGENAVSVQITLARLRAELGFGFALTILRTSVEAGPVAELRRGLGFYDDGVSTTGAT
ncbi:hypothetical protein QWZ10_18145 [Paracoccus cavernae]|uniref:Uncharacterized protein n=1 Tax=Paracoccus cavernae TaxID=1571207 RepID=A0ABT8D8S4_9RHOB|nr:hypothetical protein [Paracoccus cavernae]